MNSKHNQSSRRHPLKRVRTDNENYGSIISLSNGRNNKKFCRQSSEDSAFVEIEKSSDERAFDLFYKEYFSQFRPYFKHRSIVIQFIEHLWSNMIELSKVAFVKKILKEHDISSTNFNDSDTYSNDENDSQINKTLNKNFSILNSNNKYSRTFINEFLFYLKHFITPRFIDKNSSSNIQIPLRRSSRIRRAPIKCVCSTCVTTCVTNEDSSSINNDLQHKIFRQLIDYYHQLDDQYMDISNSSLSINNDNQIHTPSSEVTETSRDVRSSPLINSMVSVDNTDVSFPSLDLLIDSSITSNEKFPLVVSDTLPINDQVVRRTYVILTELDEPFFGPYPIEFTITI